MSAPARSLAGSVGVVTGASSGIGAATAQALAAAGMRVVAGARRGDRLQAVCDEIRAAGGVAEPVVADMRDEGQVTALVDAAVTRFGRLDTLVNNAGTGVVRLVEEGRVEEWRSILETNVVGTLVACRAALRHMLPRGHGDIVNMTSVSAGEAWPYMAAYAGSKAAVYALSQALRREVAPRGVRVMTIAVHNIGTEFGTNFDTDVLPDAVRRWQALGLLNREAQLLEPADVARAIVYMISQPDPVSVHELEVRSRAN
ncbi:MAG TPA: SDR family oxidoreductase [Candidatus Eisenbacteria bacterium]|nr:SDR family oxidoreductase [Candidatus Eisenbacteria bacterium]